MLYLLQLVQALRFETQAESRKRRKVVEESDSGLAQFLIERSVANPVLGTSFHWYLMIECDTRSAVGKAYAKVAFRFMQRLAEVSDNIGYRAIARLTIFRPRAVPRSAIFCVGKASSLSFSRSGPRISVTRRMVVRKRSKS